MSVRPLLLFLTLFVKSRGDDEDPPGEDSAFTKNWGPIQWGPAIGIVGGVTGILTFGIVIFWPWVKRTSILFFVKRNSMALQSAPWEMRNNQDIVLAAVKQDGNAFQYASVEMKGDKDIVLAAVEQKGRALQYASKQSKGDREVVFAAVKKDGFSLYVASDEMKEDEDIVLAAVLNNGHALLFAGSIKLEGDMQVLTEDDEESGHVLRELKGEKAIVLAAVKMNGMVLEHASAELKGDNE